MSEKADYDQLVSERNATEYRIADARSQQTQVQAKIERLKTAKQILDSCYDSFEDVKKSVHKELTRNYQWKGTKYDEFVQMGNSLDYSNYVYLDSLDKARDDINLKIVELENESFEIAGFIGDLLAWLNTLVHKIENHFND